MQRPPYPDQIAMSIVSESITFLNELAKVAKEVRQKEGNVQAEFYISQQLYTISKRDSTLAKLYVFTRGIEPTGGGWADDGRRPRVTESAARVLRMLEIIETLSERLQKIHLEALVMNVQGVPSFVKRELTKLDNESSGGELESLFRMALTVGFVPAKREIPAAAARPAQAPQPSPLQQSRAQAPQQLDAVVEAAIQSLNKLITQLPAMILQMNYDYNACAHQICFALEKESTRGPLAQLYSLIGLNSPAVVMSPENELAKGKRQVDRAVEIINGAIAVLKEVKGQSADNLKYRLSAGRFALLMRTVVNQQIVELPQYLAAQQERAPVQERKEQKKEPIAEAKLGQSRFAASAQPPRHVSPEDARADAAVQAVITFLSQLRDRVPQMLRESNNNYAACAQRISAALSAEYDRHGSLFDFSASTGLTQYARKQPEDRLAKGQRQVERALEIIDGALVVFRGIKGHSLAEIQDNFRAFGSGQGRYQALMEAVLTEQIIERRDYVAQQERAPVQERKEQKKEEMLAPESRDVKLRKAIQAAIVSLSQLRARVPDMLRESNNNYTECAKKICDLLNNEVNTPAGSLFKLNALMGYITWATRPRPEKDLAKGQRQIDRALEIIDAAVAELNSVNISEIDIQTMLAVGKVRVLVDGALVRQIIERRDYVAQQYRAPEPAQSRFAASAQPPREFVMGPPTILPGQRREDQISPITIVYRPEQIEKLRASVIQQPGPAALSAFGGQDPINNIEHARRFLATFVINSKTSAGDCRKFVDVQIKWREQIGPNYPLLKEAALFSPEAALKICLTRFCQHFSVADVLEIYRAHQDNEEFAPKIKEALAALRPRLNVDVINKEEVTCRLTGEVFKEPVQVNGQDQYGNPRAFIFEKAEIVRRIQAGGGCIENPFSPGNFILEDMLERAEQMEMKLMQYGYDSAAKPVAKEVKAPAPAAMREEKKAEPVEEKKAEAVPEKKVEPVEEKKPEPEEELIDEDDICCPITWNPIVDAVKVVERDGVPVDPKKDAEDIKAGKVIDKSKDKPFYFEKSAIEGLLKHNNGTAPNPKTRAPITAAMLQEAPEMMEKVKQYEAQQARLGKNL